LLRQVSVDVPDYFDTNVSAHTILLENSHELVEFRIPSGVAEDAGSAEGYEIAGSTWSCGYARSAELLASAIVLIVMAALVAGIHV